jgi:hypothetical protein
MFLVFDLGFWGLEFRVEGTESGVEALILGFRLGV